VRETGTRARPLKAHWFCRSLNKKTLETTASNVSYFINFYSKLPVCVCVCVWCCVWCVVCLCGVCVVLCVVMCVWCVVCVCGVFVWCVCVWRGCTSDFASNLLRVPHEVPFRKRSKYFKQCWILFYYELTSCSVVRGATELENVSRKDMLLLMEASLRN
jgi:hypothetical protein